MHDLREGVSSAGTIATGAGRERVPAVFEAALDAAIVAVSDARPDASLYVYGSVATGVAQADTSDIDLLTVGLPSGDAASIGRTLSSQFSDLCRSVEVAAAEPRDFIGETDAAYGGRAFLRHYCVHLSGPDLHSNLPDFPADANAARGFNGDIAVEAQRWRLELGSGGDPVQLGRRVARKSLLAVAGLVSVHDDTWTTDRATAAARWAEIEPILADDLMTLAAWSDDRAAPDRPAIQAALDGVVAQVVAAFEATIGLWGHTTT